MLGRNYSAFLTEDGTPAEHEGFTSLHLRSLAPNQMLPASCYLLHSRRAIPSLRKIMANGL
jgi:hypothetical protein